MTGSLSIVATPIGNLEDFSPRALKTLAAADVIACEDTRVSRKLAAMAGSRATLLSYGAPNERTRTPDIVKRIAAGARVALVTDAGTPGVSDPGQKLIAACRDAGLKVEVIPGPSAAIAALVTSGLPTARFIFEGFLPRTAGARRKRLTAMAHEERTMVFFEAPHRIAATLADMADVLGDERRAALTRELTKIHEEVVVATLAELRDAAVAKGVRGEITMVVSGAEPVEAEIDDADLVERVRGLVAEGHTKKDAVARVALETGAPKKAVYQAVIDAGL